MSSDLGKIPPKTYDAVLVDCMNLFYRQKSSEFEAYDMLEINMKVVYKNLIVKFIEKIKWLESTYMTPGGIIYLLFDNPTSRFDLQKSFYFAQRKHIYPKYKEQRTKESKEFYNSLDLIRYYYLTNKPTYVSIQIRNVEADDLVKPVLVNYCKGKSALLVTNDYDWTRYLSAEVDWLPDYYQAPQTIHDFFTKKGFKPTEQSIILYKSIFGDPSDNIPKLITENAVTLGEFLQLIERYPSLTSDMVLALSCVTKELASYSILRAVHEYDRQFRINVQLTSTIPISVEHLSAVTCTGRQATIITESIEIVLGLQQKTQEFVFGNIRYAMPPPATCLDEVES